MAIYLPELELLFAHIPKAGGTWVKKALRSSGLRVEDAHGVGSHNLPAAYRDRGKRFCFVRDPLTWYSSVWRGLQSSWPDHREVLPLHEERSWSPIRMLTYLAGERDYSAFAERILKDQPGFCSRMYEWYIGPPGAPQVDAVGRMEYLASDLQTILEKFGFRGQLAPTPKENEGPQMEVVHHAGLAKAEIVAYNRFYSSEGPFFLTR